MDEQPRAFVTPEVREAWAQGDARIFRSLERAKRELSSLCCDVCGTGFAIDTGRVPGIRYRCEHGLVVH